MARQNYQRLSPADIDDIWSRMSAGHAVKPTARSPGLATSTVGPTCCAAAGSDLTHDTEQLES